MMGTYARVMLGAAVCAAILGGTAGCSSGPSGDYQTCKAGLEHAAASGNSNAQPPAACGHLSQAQVDSIAQQVMNKGLRKIMKQNGFGASPSATPGSVPQCTARIERDSANGNTPYAGAQAHDPRLPAPCRPLSPDQLLKALDQAVKDLEG